MSTDALIGPTFEDFKERAYTAVMNHFVGIALKDKRPPTQRAMDSVKLQEAYRVQRGETSLLITKEAEARGVEVNDLVGLIVYEGQKAFNIELDRVRVGLALDAATDYQGILDVLRREGVDFNRHVE